jgi:hypothetical protein
MLAQHYRGYGARPEATALGLGSAQPPPARAAPARAALSQLGLPPVAIPRHPSGAPIWPQGFAGSISHTNDLAATIMAQSPPIRGLGLDIEGDEPLDDATMVELVCRPEELVPDCGPSHPANLRRGNCSLLSRRLSTSCIGLYPTCSSTFKMSISRCQYYAR